MFLYKIQDHYFCLKLSNWLATGKISFDSDVAEKKKKKMQEVFYSPRRRLGLKGPIRVDLLWFCKQTTWSYIWQKVS